MIDKVWDKAKQIVVDNKLPSDWVTILDVYHYIGGTDKRMYAIMSDEVTYRVLAIINPSEVLVLNTRTKALEVADAKEVHVAKKQFADQEGAGLVTMKVPKEVLDNLHHEYARYLTSDSTNITFKD